MPKILKKLEIYLDNINEKSRSLILISSILICIVTAGIAISIELYISKHNENSIEAMVGIGNTKAFKEYEQMKKNFDNYFSNSFKSEGNITLKKNNDSKNYVYTGYDVSRNDNEYYSVDARIPIVNIDNTKVSDLNQRIRLDFYDKADSITKQKETYIEYKVSYVSFINNNVLSIAIKSSYKENESNEKIIIKTYNYDINTNEFIEFNDLANIKKLSKGKIQSKINSSISLAYEYAKEKIPNYYKRKINSQVYKYDNIENYLYTNEGDLYIIYSYGDTDDTNEYDVVYLNN